MRPPAHVRERVELHGRPGSVAIRFGAGGGTRTLFSYQVQAPIPSRPAGIRNDDSRQVSVTNAKVWAPRGQGVGHRAGEPVEAVVADNLVQIYHREVLVASHVQRQNAGGMPRPPRQGRRSARAATSGIVVTRVVDNNGDVSFAGTTYRAGRPWRGKQVEVSIVAGSVQIACAGTIVRTHAIRHDRAKEHGAYATPQGRSRKLRQDAPNGAAVTGVPLRGRPDGRSLTRPLNRRSPQRRGNQPQRVSPVKHLPELIRQAGAGT